MRVVEAQRRPALGWWVPGVAGVVALLARPWFLPAGVAVGWRVAFFVALGAAGLAWSPNRSASLRASKTPLSGTQNAASGWRVSLVVLAVGAVAFTLGRAVVELPVRPWGVAVAVGLNALAALAEEAFFRRYLYGLVTERHGEVVAVVVTAGAFALVHVTVWGWWVLPLDLAAGLVLSWQRAATGRWSVPAATHVLANTLALL
ncbi:MAG TPA: CPBP family glutamic-type intramembrane protease [Acidimicrobiales bacterium]|nr:CPBP family glutamic-type intramembrane protease [Acidimicrobiales bacterium]